MAIEPKANNTPWKWCGHSWSDESVYDSEGNVVCTKSIYDEATEETQEALEREMTQNMKFITEAPQQIADLKAQVAEKGRVIEALAEAYWNHDDYGFSEFKEVKQWAEAKAKEQA